MVARGRDWGRGAESGDNEYGQDSREKRHYIK